MDIRVKRVLLLIIALVVSMACAYITDRVVFKYSGHFDTIIHDTPIFEDGSEAYGIANCDISDKKLTVTGVDPQFVVSATKEEVSLVHIQFSEPVAKDTLLQVFYAVPGNSFGEKNSVYRTITAGKTEEMITIPKAVYSMLRFDFEEDISLDKISTGNEERVYSEYKPHAVRLIVFSLVFLIPLCSAALKLTKKKAEKN